MHAPPPRAPHEDKALLPTHAPPACHPPFPAAQGRSGTEMLPTDPRTRHGNVEKREPAVSLRQAVRGAARQLEGQVVEARARGIPRLPLLDRPHLVRQFGLDERRERVRLSPAPISRSPATSMQNHAGMHARDTEQGGGAGRMRQGKKKIECWGVWPPGDTCGGRRCTPSCR